MAPSLTCFLQKDEDLSFPLQDPCQGTSVTPDGVSCAETGRCLEFTSYPDCLVSEIQAQGESLSQTMKVDEGGDGLAAKSASCSC